jgi:hypothetical protein
MTDKITQNELFDMFGDFIPMEAVQILFNSPKADTIDEVRAKVLALAAKSKP